MGNNNNMAGDRLITMFKKWIRSKSKKVVYVPGSTQAQLESQVGPHHRPTRYPLLASSARTESEMDLPPSIAISADGEEGYQNSQRALQISCDLSGEVGRESVCPPPNRTVYDGESPPPYRSQSMGLVDEHSGKAATKLLRDYNGSPLVVRCHSMPVNNNSPHWTAHTQRHDTPPTRRTATPSRHSARHSRNVIANSSNNNTLTTPPPPPHYCDVIENFDVYSRQSSNSNV